MLLNCRPLGDCSPSEASGTCRRGLGIGILLRILVYILNNGMVAVASCTTSLTQVHGRNWDILCQAIPTKTLSQIKTYFHNYKIRLGFDKMDVPPNTAQPTCRRGQGARAIRDAAAAANVATMAAVSASGRGYDDVYGEEDHPRPAKRQATGQGPVQSSGLELGSLAGDVSPSHGDGSGGGTSPVLPPVMDLQALAHVYSGNGGVQMSPHLLLRDRDHDLTGASGGGGAASNAPATTKALLQLLRSLSELKGGPALGGASGNQGHTSREGDEVRFGADFPRFSSIPYCTASPRCVESGTRTRFLQCVWLYLVVVSLCVWVDSDLSVMPAYFVYLVWSLYRC